MRNIRQHVVKLISVERNLILALMFFGFICWTYNLGSPLLDHHSWRQTDTAAIARNFYCNGFNLLYPQIDWGGAGPAYVESEFQLVPFVISIAYLIFGVNESVARLVVISFSVGSVYLLYQLARLYFDQRSSAFSVLFFIISPIELYFGRAVMPESAMIFFSIGSLYFFDKWTRKEKGIYFATALICTALAFMVKIPTLYLGLPLLWLAYTKYGTRMFTEARLYIFAIFALAPAFFWYYHAHTVLAQYHTFNIWNIGTDKWGNLQTFLGGDFYLILFGRLFIYVFTPVGLFLVIYGIYIKPRDKEYMFYVWMLSILIYFFVVANGNMVHDYYQLPLVPVGSVFVGKALSRIYGIRRSVGIGLIFIIMLSSVYIVLPLYRVDSAIWDAGQAVDMITDKDSLIVTSTSMVGNPSLLYYAQRKGWVVSSKLSPEVVESYKKRGANYLIIVPDKLLLYDPMISRYLFQSYRSEIGSNFVIFDLSNPIDIHSAPSPAEITFKGDGVLLGGSINENLDYNLFSYLWYLYKTRGISHLLMNFRTDIKTLLIH